MMRNKCSICGKQIDYKNFYKIRIEDLSGTDSITTLMLTPVCYGCKFRITNYINERRNKYERRDS